MRWKWLRNCLLGFVVLVVVGFLARDFLFFTFLYRGTPADRELEKIRREMDVARSEFYDVRRTDLSEAELQALSARFAARETQIRQRYLKLAKDNPGTKAELFALYAVAGKWPETEEGKRALQTLIQVSETAKLDHLGETFESIHATHKESMRPLIPVLLRLERENTNHPYAAKLLTEACLFATPSEDAAAAPDEFSRIADVIVERHATSPKLSNFCEQFGRGDWSPPWAQPFESHLRRILEVNKDRFVRCSAKIALASIVQESGANRQLEAAKLFEEFLAEFDGTVQYHASSIEESYRESAQRALEVIRSHGLGKHAPKTVGNDLDGKPMALADYRGKVVLVSFWATWCFPCMKMIPHEKELVARFSADKFAIVGVNGDANIEAAREAVEKHQIPWRSFRHNHEGQDQVVDQWHVFGWPTFYLLDGNGIVRKRWVGEPAFDDLNDWVERLIESPMSEMPTAVQPSDNREPDSDVQGAYPPIDVAMDTPGATGFVGKTYQSNDDASKYVVFIPHNYNPGTSVPAILFLHGAGLQGADGRKQLTGALANAIRQHESSFPFIAVFPQAHDGDWQAESPAGKRAIAILDKVCVDYSVDRSRVFLSGLSMGGEGTWSLAAAHPDRWAAIVPICGGGDPAIAHRIKHIPCWCFHGDADRMIHPLYSRRMIEAIRKAGGQPTYHEYPGVGHNCWDRTYARTDLYEWLLMQKRR